MFDLEKQIAEWRKQMLAAGIQSPVPLEELELHLREEIEQQVKLGLNEQEAFHFAVQKIGQGRALNREFKKVEGQKIGRTILLMVGWLVAGYVLLFGTVGLDLHWNLFSFRPRWDGETVESIFIILAAEAGVWFLAKIGRDKVSRSLSLLICLGLAWFAIFDCLPAEQKIQVHSSGGSPVGEFLAAILSDRKPSPFWYRGGLALLWSLPIIFWVWREWRRAILKHNLNAAQKSARLS